ncbi:MAG TPA: phospholipid carrier-dependent glycosyltransferase [Candidatus Saccharimonadia bacterium]|jgi:dolichyl-phosphate-mannose--protein O-mannosyl transferase
MNFRRWRPELVALIAAAAGTRFWNLFTPNSVVFDEVYFKAFAAHYLDHNYYFDIHPPLVKLLLALFAHLAGISPATMLASSTSPVLLRLLPAFAGMLLVPLVWGILRRLGASRPFAFLGAFAVLLDNALLVESRFILMDSLLLLFGLGAVYLYLVARDAKGGRHWTWLLLCAIACGAALSTKWTGLGCYALVGLVWLWDQKGRAAAWATRLAEVALLIIIPALIYLGVFWVHFQLLPHSGDGDAFMSTRFQATLKDSPYYDPTVHLSFFHKFVDLNYEMFHANQTLTATHPYGSRWFTWPLEQRPIYYWEGEMQANGNQGNIYLLGNPIVWWSIWAFIFAGLSYVWIAERKLRPATLAALAIAAAGYLINLIPFMAVTRVMFLYHYFFSFVFSLIFAVMLWDDLARNRRGHVLPTSNARRSLAIVCIVILAGFIFFAPISYGWSLSPAGLQARMWLHTWR